MDYEYKNTNLLRFFYFSFGIFGSEVNSELKMFTKTKVIF